MLSSSTAGSNSGSSFLTSAFVLPFPLPSPLLSVSAGLDASKPLVDGLLLSNGLASAVSIGPAEKKLKNDYGAASRCIVRFCWH